ncbi:phosphoenolpyruvate--protein phosphotransferase [Psychrilyobacter sp.]|uniref:phosphoenolpyruvate--protein phosphotransferase n=1 Tax=Psychrilyobacter sp. TaxID=2586924 RepID=UPI00301912A6
MEKIMGKAIFEGIVIGEPYLRRKKQTALEEYKIEPHMLEDEMKRFEVALKDAKQELKFLKSSLKGKVKSNDLKILNVHLMILDDPVLLSEIGKRLKNELVNIEKVVADVVEFYVDMFKDMKDPVYRQRAIDIQDVGEKIIGQLMVEDCELHELDNKILVTKEILPSELFKMHHNKINLLGIVTEYSGATSHVAILAKTFGIPTLMEVKNVSQMEWENEIILDTRKGEPCVIKDPTDEQIIEYKKEKVKLEVIGEENKKLKGLPAITIDGIEIVLNANIGGITDLLSLNDSMAGGVGLLRTEFLYMESKFFPTEQQQIELYEKAYKKVEKLEGERELIIRTLDIGADKQLPYYEMPFEVNPFLGFRGVRFTLAHENIFRTQLRAILRVAKGRRIKVMFPMISNLKEIIQIKKILASVKTELDEEGLEYAGYIETGVMIEVPSTAFLIDKFSEYVDFFSLGTNDLTQYVMAADRLSADVAYLNDYFEPAVLRTINYIAEEAIKQKKKISVCGEMASDPMAIVALMSFGIDRFSMLSTYIPMAKRTILRLNKSVLQSELKPKLLDCNNAEEVKEILKEYIEVITVENDRS